MSAFGKLIKGLAEMQRIYLAVNLLNHEPIKSLKICSSDKRFKQKTEK